MLFKVHVSWLHLTFALICIGYTWFESFGPVLFFLASPPPMHLKRHKQTPDRRGLLFLPVCVCVCVREGERESERPQRETTMFSQPPRASNHDNRMAGRHGSSSIEAGVFLFLQNSALVAFQDRLVLLKKQRKGFFLPPLGGHKHTDTHTPP